MGDLVKNFLLGTPYDALLAGYFAHYSALKIPQSLAARAEVGLTHFRNAQWRPTTETLFVLGSGSSINDLSERDFQYIDDSDSIGFNFWPIHAFVPSIYTVEAIDTATLPELRKPILEKLAKVVFERDDYIDVPKFLTDYEKSRRATWDRMPDAWKESTFVYPTVPIFARSEEETRRAIRLLQDMGLFDQTDVLLKYRATLSLMVTFGIVHKYRRIVLCGVDITDPRYFWHDARRYPQHVDFLKPQSGTIHGTGRELPMMATIQEVLRVIRDVVARPRGIEIFVASERSALVPDFPIYRFG